MEDSAHYTELVQRLIEQSGEDPRTWHWDRDSILGVIQDWRNVREAEIAARLMDWVEEHPQLSVRFGGKQGDGGYYACADTESGGSPFVIWTYGRVEILFEYFKKRAAFAQEPVREEFRKRLIKVPGAATDIRASDVSKRPNIPMIRLGSDEARNEFFSAIDWWIDRFRRNPARV